LLTLYYAPHSRASRLIWLLEEIAEPYDLAPASVRHDLADGAPDQPQSGAHKRSLALAHDGERVTEAAAIALYLSDAFPAKLGPAVGEPGRGAFVSWLAYYTGLMEPVLAAKARDPALSDPGVAADYADMDRRLTAALGSEPYLLGARFSAADVLIAGLFHFARDLMPKGAIFDAYLARIATRPALQRAVARESADG
jgi:glutathione S-transferase